MADSYAGTEDPVELGDVASEDAAVFEVRSAKIPEKAVPIYDDAQHAVVGYCYEGATGVYFLLDVDGNVVGMEEKGLETDAIDVFDLLFFVGGIFKAVTRGATAVATRVAATSATRLTTKYFAAAVVGSMRAVFKGLSVRSLKFTVKTAQHMSTKGRFVPVHTLHQALKYGTRAADPRGAKGAFLYTAKLIKGGKKYVLEIVVREKDWTILHFVFKE